MGGAGAVRAIRRGEAHRYLGRVRNRQIERFLLTPATRQGHRASCFVRNTASTNFSRLRIPKEFRRVQMEFRSVKPPSIVRLLVVREPACELASQSPHRGKGKTSMKSENEAVPATTLMKLRIASGRGKSMLDNLTFSQCRVHTGGVGVL